MIVALPGLFSYPFFSKERLFLTLLFFWSSNRTVTFFNISDMFVSMFTYYKLIEQLSRERPEQVLNIHFEDMKKVLY